MKTKLIFVILTLLLLIVFFSGCSTTVSDSGLNLKTIGNKIDSNIYILNVTMIGSSVSNKNLGGEGVSRQYGDLYGYGNTRLWQDGKGMVMVKVNSISPNLAYIQKGQIAVLKTTDLKIMAIADGYQFSVKCRNDYEPIAALQNNEISSERYDTWELDYCRMANPELVFDNSDEIK